MPLEEMAWEIRFQPDPASIVDEYEKFFGDGLHPRTRSGRSTAQILVELRTFPTAEQIETIIGTDVWTVIKCDVCRRSREAVIAIEATNGEAEVELCA
jgi:hypothetical protein